jgi:hypothetical protein
VELIRTIPPSEPPKRQDDEESDPFDVDFDDSPEMMMNLETMNLDDETRFLSTKRKLTSILRNT